MLHRWMKSVAALAIACIFFTGCRKNEFSDDSPLPDTYGPIVLTTSHNNFLYALDPTTGVRKWELRLPEKLESTPVIIGDYAYLTINALYKIDLKKGTVVKKFDPTTHTKEFRHFYTTPYADGNMLYMGSRNDTLYAFNVDDEQIKWFYDTGDPLMSSPTVYDGKVIIGGTNQKVFAIDKTAGTLTWVFSQGSSYVSSPTIGRTMTGRAHVYIGGMDGRLYALDAATGEKIWDYPTGGSITTDPIAYGGNVIFGSYDYFVYCIDTAARKERWKFKTGDRVLSSPFASDNVVYAGSLDYNLYALNIIDGSEKWKYKTGALIKSSPLVHEGIVYQGSYDKNLYAFDTSGRLKWAYNNNGIMESSPVIWDLSKAYYPAPAGNSKD